MTSSHLFHRAKTMWRQKEFAGTLVSCSCSNAASQIRFSTPAKFPQETRKYPPLDTPARSLPTIFLIIIPIDDSSGIKAYDLTASSSLSTTSSVLTPSASALKFVTSRCRSTDGATARTSSRLGTGLPSRAASAFAPSIRY